MLFLRRMISTPVAAMLSRSVSKACLLASSSPAQPSVSSTARRAGLIAIGAAVTGVADKDDAQYWGILGVLLVLLVGLLLLLPVRSGVREDSALVTHA